MIDLRAVVLDDRHHAIKHLVYGAPTIINTYLSPRLEHASA
jgi:hypothetical protein